jgi:hypothetical protein
MQVIYSIKPVIKAMFVMLILNTNKKGLVFATSNSVLNMIFSSMLFIF